jgi:hypothetical protein
VGKQAPDDQSNALRLSLLVADTALRIICSTVLDSLKFMVWAV